MATAQSQAVSGNDCWGQSFGYDRYANLLSINVTKCSAPILNLSVNNNNRVTNSGFTYDAAGDLLTDGSNTYTWNAEGRMATTAGVTYTYDGDGRRVKKSNGKLYWYGMGGEVLAESDLNGNILWEYIYFNGQRVARRDPVSGTAHYYLADRLGSARTIAKISSSGVYQGVVEESDFYPYGTERPITNDPNTPDNPYKFTGHERDSETGLDHTLYRQYASNLGRWHSPDPKHGKLSDPQSWNRYAYVGSSPCNFVDSNGGERTAPPPDFGSFGSSGRNDGPLFIRPDDLTKEERLKAIGIDTRTLYEKAEDAVYEAGKNLMAMLSGELGSDCAHDLDALGVSAEAIKAGARSMRILNGFTSDRNYAQAIYGNTSPNAVAIVGQTNPGTVADYFNNSAGTTAVAQILGHDIYIDPNWVNTAGADGLMYTVFHELIHNVKGTVDEDIQRTLGLEIGAPSHNITEKLRADCPWTIN